MSAPDCRSGLPTVAQRTDGDTPSVDPASLSIEIARFDRLTDNHPQSGSLLWTTFVPELLRHEERPIKDGPLWSPTRYRHDAKRGKVGVETITAAAIDYDGCVPEWSLLAGLEYVAHTTFSHTAATPHWRVILPFANPVPADQWREMWRRIIFWLAPRADKSCGDESRVYHLPSCPPDAEREASHHKGRLLDWHVLPQADDTSAGPTNDDILGRAEHRVGGLDFREYVEGIGEGERDTKLFALAGRLRRDNTSLDIARMNLRMAARLCDPPFDEDKAAEMVERVWQNYSPADSRGGVPAYPFPIDALPPGASRFVVEVAAEMGVPTEFVAIPLLGAAAAVIGNRLEIAFKRGWKMPPNIFAACVARPGSGKTPSQTKALAPFHRLQRRLEWGHRSQMAEWRPRHGEWEHAGKKQGQPEPEPPPYPHLYTTDATVEALVPMLANSPGILLELDEMSGWVAAMDQYKNGKGADRQCYLSLWGCNEIKVDRKGRLHEPVTVNRPCLSVVGGIQPSLLRTLARQEGDDGFIDRLLLSVPDPTVPGWTDEEVSDAAIEGMNDVFELLHALPYSVGEFGDPAPFVVGLCPEAEECLKAWTEENRQQQLDGIPEHLEGAWAKMPSQLGRLALILHALSTVRPTARYTSVAALVDGAGTSIVAPQVSLETLTAAIKLVDYFKSHARRAHDLMRSGRSSGDQSIEFARRKIIDALRETGRMSQSDLLHKVFQRNHGEAMRQALEALEREGVIKKEIESAPGRPPTTYWSLVADQEGKAA